ncbi:DUF6083 domain-containing protein [Streptomyces sp. NPDC015684]|uniref:DUF6083 domain-containing protein n=1 Tax=Streptomyces sp. NPDC015684 TaxID=3364963 RepID=UPI00370275DC
MTLAVRLSRSHWLQGAPAASTPVSPVCERPGNSVRFALYAWDGQSADPRCMGVSENAARRLGGARLQCPYCGLLQERMATLEHDWVLLEPDMTPPAHVVPAEYRWIETSDGRVTVYGVCPPDPFQRCRIEHRLACPEQTLPDLWPWLTSLRGENARQAERLNEPEPPRPPEQWPDAG